MLLCLSASLSQCFSITIFLCFYLNRYFSLPLVFVFYYPIICKHIDMNWENIDRKKDSITYLIEFETKRDEKNREVLKAVAKERKKTSILEDRERDRDEETETQTKRKRHKQEDREGGRRRMRCTKHKRQKLFYMKHARWYFYLSLHVHTNSVFCTYLFCTSDLTWLVDAVQVLVAKKIK